MSQPLDIVEKYRSVYRERYMEPTLSVMAPTELVVAAHYGGLGSKDNKIKIAFDGPVHPQIWASNDVQFLNGVGSAVIQVNPELIRETDEIRKMVLGHEWIEVMMTFEEGTRPSKRVESGRIEMLLLFAALGAPAPWEDSDDFKSRMHLGLRSLLVSDESIGDMATQLGSPIDGIRTQMTDGPKEAQQMIEQLITGFSDKWSVSRRLVIQRLREILIRGNGDRGNGA